jgi:transcriptional regulator of acetoin/glycerol metabolism
MNRRIEIIPIDVMETLAGQPWAGNIRELENFIERAVILTQGTVLQAPLDGLGQRNEDIAADPVTLKDAERVHILRILREVNGLIAPAAARLGLPRSTLFYKMRRLGITAPRAGKVRNEDRTMHARV